MCVLAVREAPAQTAGGTNPPARAKTGMCGSPNGRPLLCKRNGLVCVAQKWCKVTGRFEMSERAAGACKFYKLKRDGG